jgi:biopolymer transport protein ExbB/TolQ
MRAFHDMARTGSAGPSVVAAGVAEALFTTAAGLCVAVPAVMLYNHLVRRMGVMLTTAENQARDLRIGLASGSHPIERENSRPADEPRAAEPFANAA